MANSTNTPLNTEMRNQQFNTLYSGPLRDLESTKTPFQHAYPGDLGTIDHWVAFTAVNRTRARRDAQARKTNLGTIFLPIPASLGTSYSSQYESESLGPFGQIAAESGGDIVGSAVRSGSAKGVGKRLADSISKIQSQDVSGSLLNTMASGIESGVSTLVSAGATSLAGGGAAATGGAALTTVVANQIIKGGLYGAGIARNPHMAVLFAGVDFKSHQFQYKLIARTKGEALAIRNIIHKFKFHMLPDYKLRDHFFLYPDEFEIDFFHNKYLFNIHTSVLKSFDVQYHGEGIPAYMSDEPDTTDPNALDSEIQKEVVPLSVTISLQFQEIAIPTRQSVVEDNR